MQQTTPARDTAAVTQVTETSFSRFFRTATQEEKERIFSIIAHEAAQEQAAIIKQAQAIEATPA